MKISLQDSLFSSKTQKKKYLDILYSLAGSFAISSDKILQSLALPDEFYQEIKLLKRINNGNARKRQQQLLAKMLRESELDYEQILSLVKLIRDKEDGALIVAQIWASKLVKEEQVLDEFIALYNVREESEFRDLVFLSVDHDVNYNLLIRSLKKIMTQYIFS